MKKDRKWHSICAIVVAGIFLNYAGKMFDRQEEKKVTVGIIYVGDESTAYTMNFVKAQNAIVIRCG